MDSATAMAIAHRDGYHLYALTFRCGSGLAPRLEAARQVAARFGVSGHTEVDVDQTALAEQGGSGVVQLNGASSPGRNTVFLALAVAWAEALETDDLFLGITAADRRHRPDA